MQKPPRPKSPPEVEEDYDDGDPYSCIAAGAAGIEPKVPNYRYLLTDAFKRNRPHEVRALVERDPAWVRVALYDIWDSERESRHSRDRAVWAARLMADMGDPSLVEYDQAEPPCQATG